jgi:hypothetical protein
MLDDRHRAKVIEERDRYEAAFRRVLSDGAGDGSFRDDIDPKTASIFILSMLNAIDRWYRPGGALSREQLVEELSLFVIDGLG